MRILLAISSLGAGGAERVMTLLAGGFADRSHEVWLLTLAEAERDFFPLDPRVRRVAIGREGNSRNVVSGLWANVLRLRGLRRTVASVEPHAVLSFMTSTNVLTILACRGLRTRIVVSERTDPAAHREKRVWIVLRALLYQRADAVVVQTHEVAEWFRRRLRKGAHVVVIPNPVATACDLEPSAELSRPFVLAAGRLGHEKGFDVLIRAFGAVSARNPELQLIIAGEGSEERNLRAVVSSLDLDARVCLPGRVRNLSALMRGAVAFILPSRYEGFPNVLLEALAVGVPCVAADSSAATREILGDGAYGLLVPPDDSEALATAINLLATDAELRQRLSRAATVAIERYDLDRIVNQWERVLAGV
jgi:glycosyltransferase involved in cell wall biosynthesis